MQSQVIIRMATTADFGVIAGFVQDLEESTFDLKIMENAFEKNLKLPDSVYLIAENDQQALGYLSCHTQLLLHHGGRKVAEIQEMYVAPAFRNMGIGMMMLNELKKLLRQKGINNLEVCSNLSRKDTHRFYEREGLTPSHYKFTRSKP